MHLTSGAVQCHVLESLIFQGRSGTALADSSPADETWNRRNIDVLGRGVILVISLPLSLRKVSQHVCVSGFGIGQSASPRVCVCACECIS